MTRLLLVEDSPTQAEELRLVLEGAGFETETAPDGETALERLKEADFDLVLSDIVMPGLSGYDLCRAIKADPRRRELPVILLTTLSDPMDIIEGLESAADNFITKPVEPSYLVARVTNVLTSRQMVADGRLRLGVEFLFMGRTFTITSDKQQILGLLLSTFEDIVRTNQELQASQQELAAAKTRLEEHAGRLEGRVRASGEKYRSLMERANDAILILDAEGRIQEVNRKTEEWLACSRTEILGRHFSQLLPAADRGQREAQFQGLLANGTLRADDIWVERPSGDRIPVDLSASLVAVDGERVAVFIMHDITERKRAEQALRESEAGFRLLFASNPQPMWLYEVESLRFLEVNEAAVSHYGYSREEFLGMRITDIRPPEEVPRLVKHVATSSPTLKHSGGWRHRLKDGRIIHVETISQTLEFVGRRAALVVAQDVTERKRAEEALRRSEEQLRQAQKMEAIGKLAGGVAHDFNNLLTAITGYSELLLHQCGEEQARKDLEEIRRAADRAAGLTRQLLAFSRRQVLQPRVLDVNAVVADTAKMLKRLIGEDVELVTYLDPNPGRVKADPGQLEQVILNLAVNARDAMPEGGTLTIETANVELDEPYAREHASVEPGPYAVLAVSDTGCGMTPEVQARIFEPFFTTKDPEKGTGLGLSTVYGIVKQSGGNVWVYSEPGKGTTFKIYLPQVDEPLDAKVAPNVHARPARGAETILLVEDEKGVRALARRVLQEAGYTVLEARDGDEAVKLSEDHKGAIALMVTDMVMPGTSGAELAARFAASRPEMKVLYMSGYTDKAILSQQLFRPGTPFLDKPFTPRVLAGKVREVLDSPPPVAGRGEVGMSTGSGRTEDA